MCESTGVSYNTDNTGLYGIQLIFRSIRNMGSLVEMITVDNTNNANNTDKNLNEMYEAIEYFNKCQENCNEDSDVGVSNSQAIAVNLEIIKMNSDRRMNCYSKYIEISEKLLRAVKDSIKPPNLDNG